MIRNPHRIGNFTSGSISPLTTSGRAKGSLGAPALNYIEEKNMERLLGRSLQDEVTARPLQWGKLLEGRVFDLLGLDYTLTSTETDVHPEIDFWAGSKDGTREGEERAVIDIKCPITLKSFMQLVKPLYDGLTGMEAMQAVRDNHKSGEDYYWQLVSNACIIGAEWAELIVYMPYESELPEIKMRAEGEVFWIWAALQDELPYILDGGRFQNINVIRFQVPQSDKDFLTERVMKAGELLTPRPNLLLASSDTEVNAIIIEKI
jgi:hypothetical protein